MNVTLTSIRTHACARECASVRVHGTPTNLQNQQAMIAVALWCGTRTVRSDTVQADTTQYAGYRWVPTVLGGVRDDGPPTSESTTNKSTGRDSSQLRRSHRRSVIPMAPTELPTADVRIVYTLGMLPRSDTHQWCRLLSEFHSDEEVQQTLAGIRASAQQHLRWKTSPYGLSYESKQPILKGTRLSYFSGKLTTRTAAASSNHLITLGDLVDGHKYEVVIDGSDISSEGSVLWLGQAMNHSCSPNAEVEVIETASGLDLLAVKTLKDIPAGVEVTIHYDQQATEKDKRDHCTFWQWYPPTSRPPTGCWHRIKCGCAQPCPNGLWRDEIRLRTVGTRVSTKKKEAAATAMVRISPIRTMKQEHTTVPDTVGANGSALDCVYVETDLRRSIMTDPCERLEPAGDCSNGPLCDLLALTDDRMLGPKPESELRVPQAGKMQLGTDRQGSTGISLHHIDCVAISGRDPPEFLENLLPLQGLQEGDLESAGLMLTRSVSTGLPTVFTSLLSAGSRLAVPATKSVPTEQISNDLVPAGPVVADTSNTELYAGGPSTILEAERALRLFDCSTCWGPPSSVTRFERLARRRQFSMPTPGWEWVDVILHRFPALGRLKAFEKYS